MKVTTWNNGTFNPSGAGYGIRIPREFRDAHFKPEWDSVQLHIEDKVININLKPTFWTTCNELRSKEIGSYLIKHGLGKWDKGQPHILNLELVNRSSFQLKI